MTKDFALIEPSDEEPKPEPATGKRKSKKSDQNLPPAEPTEAKKAPPQRVEKWSPTEEQYRSIYELAELGWPISKMHEAFAISSQAFAGAIIRLPRIKAEIDAGVAECKALPERQLSWRPFPEDIDRIRQYAAEGLGPVEIAAKLNVRRQTFMLRMNDTPQVAAAFEEGNGEYREEVLDQANKLRRDCDEDLKHMNPMLTFLMKTICGMAEPKNTVEPTTTNVNITNNTVQFQVPKAVTTDNVAEYARIEMERAAEISKQKLAQPVVDAEVVKD